ncbi:MAG TPA: TonB-dependent receptor [Longimicrobiales bacterium]|nr:TonB-dependent receptor [Longimicrobiales bacterium]
MQKLGIALLLLILAAGSARAQTSVRGRVMTPAGDAVNSATVMLLHSGVAVRATESDSTGAFELDDVASGEYMLRVQRIGFAPTDRAISVRRTPVALDVRLVESAVAVEGVTVEGMRARAKFQNEAGVTSRELSKAELKLIPGLAETDVLRAVEALPGVVSTSDFSSAYNVRGGSADQNLILIDGIPVYNPFHLGGMFSIFNSDLVERAELLAGGFPAEYGGRVSSVLNVVSDVGPGKLDVRAGVSLLATRLSIAGGLSSQTSKKLGISSARFRVGGRRSYFDRLFKPLFDFPYHLTDLQFAAEVWSSSSSRFSASAYVGNDVLNFAGVDSFPLQLDWHWGNALGGVSWRKNFKGGALLDVRSSYSRFNTHILFPDFNDTRFRSLIDHALLHAGVAIPKGRVEVKLGADLNRMWYSNTAEAGGTVFRQGSEVGWQPSLYAQATMRPNPKWLIELGAREDWYQTEATSPNIAELSPRLAIKRFVAGGDAAFKISVGRYTQFLHSLRDEEFPIGIDVWVLTGQRAPHVVSNQVQTGFEWFPANGWYMAVEAYHRGFDGVATNNFADDPNTNRDDLIAGDGLSYGADAVVRKDEGRLRGFITVSWLRASRTFPDTNSPLQPFPDVTYPPLFDRRLDIDILLRFRLPRGWESGVRWNFGSGLPYTKPVGSYLYYQYHINNGTRGGEGSDSTVAILLEPRNSTRYPAYHRLDVSVRKLFPKRWGSIEPHLDILNVYNRKNVLFYFYDFNRMPAVRAGVSMFPVLPTIGMEVVF